MTRIQNSVSEKTCERCGDKFGCGVNTSLDCWCKSAPPLRPIPIQYKDCLCRTCLDSFASTTTAATTAGVEGDDFYYEKGLVVFTEAYHLKRGECCNNGCRHCPY
ncbi:MAG: cysteine-rich CWC family protein [Bdellovibrionota bacterium]